MRERHHLWIANQNYDVAKVHRGVAKTLFNYAVDKFGAVAMGGPGSQPIRDYCLGRIEDDPEHPFVGFMQNPVTIAAIDEAPPERHALALCSNGTRLVGLLRLYGASCYRVHLGPPPNGQRFLHSQRIDYNGNGRA